MATKMTREEAINTVRNIYQTDKEKDALGILIPELAESEDERIRRWLCDYFSSIDKAWIHKDITCIDILRWLEKQKEQKKEKFPPYVTGFKGHPDPAGTSDLEEAAKEYASKTLCDPDDGPSTGLAKESFIAGAEWQKEQKPVVTHGETYHVDTLGTQQVIAGKMPQKSAEWSDEDEEKLKAICTYLRDYPRLAKLGDKLRFNEYCDFLKSLRPSWKPSEQEKGALRTAIHILTDERNFPKAAAQLQNILNAFEGEESRKDWKPSEEQMVALFDIIHPADTVNRSALESLYEQLKKLK